MVKKESWMKSGKYRRTGLTKTATNGLKEHERKIHKAAQLGERISHMFISVYFKDVSMFDYPDVYDNMTFDYVKEVFENHFNLDNLAVSVVNPV